MSDDVETRLRERIDLLTQASAGMPPVRIHASRQDVDALARKYGAGLSGKIWLDGVEVACHKRMRDES